MLTFLSNALSKKSKRTHSKQARRGRSMGLAVESLETRLMMSVTASYDNGALVVNGDGQNNYIRIENGGYLGGVRVFADGQYINIAYGEFSELSISPLAIEIYGSGGNDTLWTDSIYNFRGEVLMDGGDGNDLLSMAHAANYRESMLIGGSGRDILVGGRHTDRLHGNAGRDVLIGGRGADFLYGGDAEDLLVPGYTNFDLDMVALREIRAFWARTDLSYAQRVDSLLYGRNGYTGNALNESTVHTDSHRDEMFGDAALDCFFSDFGQDDVRDTGGTGERLNEIWRP